MQLHTLRLLHTHTEPSGGQSNQILYLYKSSIPTIYTVQIRLLKVTGSILMLQLVKEEEAI